MTQADNVLFFDILFSILLFTFGVGTGQGNLQAFQTVQAPVISSQPNISGLQVNVLSSIVIATAYIAWAIENIPALAIYFINIILLFANTILQITFSPAFSANGVPFLGFIWTGLQIYVIWEVFRTIRGQSTGV